MSNDALRLSTGAHLSPPEPKAWTLASVGAPTTYPASVFLDIANKLQVSNQGKIGCCVGCTFEEIVRMIQLVLKPAEQQQELSWRFVYALCKAVDGVQDEGTYPSLAASIIRNYGVPLAKYCPNDVSLDHETFVFNRKLKDRAAIIAQFGQAAIDDAATRKSGADLTEPVSEEGIKRALTYAKQNNGGVAILRQIGNEYWTDKKTGNSSWDKSKLLPMPAPTAIVSGHEETLYGYDTDPSNGRTRIYWLNHWSDSWCSTHGNQHDGGRGWEYLDTWLPFIKELRVVVPALPAAPNTFSYLFLKTLTLGSTGADVVALQHALQIDGEFTYPTFTGNYGTITQDAVKAFQVKYASEILTPAGLTQPTGTVGLYTLKKLNALFSPK